MMKRQLELRKEETRAIHEKCDSLEAQLSRLREMARKTSDAIPKQAGDEVLVPSNDLPSLPVDVINHWAEEL